MTVKDLVNFYFLKEEDIIDDKYYDPQDVDIDTNIGVKDLRQKFNITKPNPYGGTPLQDKICDGAGHYVRCPYYLIEVTASDIFKAIIQLKSTIKHIYKCGDEVRKVAIVIDDNRWNERLARNYYKIGQQDKLLYKRGRNINEKIHVRQGGQNLTFDIYCYKENFIRFGLVR